jgi:aspartyl-tRNA(Asn)/glutamyl-tRNA(Gln) amidotransferase subunit C
MKISVSDVEHIAALARMKLTDEEKNTYRLQLSDMLNYIEKLGELDTANIDPTSHVVPLSNVFRDDVLKESLITEEALRNAPQVAESLYKVPRIIE